MILGEKELAWQTQVEGVAHSHRWHVFRQSPPKASQDQAAPSLILIRGEQLLAVYLRLRVRADRMPPAAALAARLGERAVVWAPPMWSEIVATLRSAPTDEHWIVRKVYGKAARRGVILGDPDQPARETRLHPDLTAPEDVRNP